ncbi:hypothetical protein AMK59_6132 [Oryctes borbonicus]|uniref:Uncharacterized protein n=1 Tax=Oryctes borbonicus TaxID=1629725 RepID=A0A0T6B092_9SCAR|nr:hypothetical protein AMK59_6132 [Oryctes borbonicus]
MAASSGILPTYQRFVNGVPVALARRSFRPREKYVILLVFATFGLVCFGTFFFLPEFRSGGGTADSVYKVYDQFKKAGPEFLIPPPPLLEENQKVVRHDRDTQDDPHVLDDREKLRAKIAQDDGFKVLEKPELYTKTSSTSKSVHSENVKPGEDSVIEAAKVTIPAAFSDHYPDVNHGEDADPTVQKRRDKIKEVTFEPLTLYVSSL